MAAESDSGRRRNCSESTEAAAARGSRRRGERRREGAETNRASTRRGKNDTKL